MMVVIIWWASTSYGEWLQQVILYVCDDWNWKLWFVSGKAVYPVCFGQWDDVKAMMIVYFVYFGQQDDMKVKVMMMVVANLIPCPLLPTRRCGPKLSVWRGKDHHHKIVKLLHWYQMFTFLCIWIVVSYLSINQCLLGHIIISWYLTREWTMTICKNIMIMPFMKYNIRTYMILEV